MLKQFVIDWEKIILKLVAHEKFDCCHQNMCGIVWNLQNSTWPVSKWRNILWTDESKIVLYGGKGSRSFVRLSPKVQYNSRFASKNIKHGGSIVMVWACFLYYGVGPIYWIKTIMDQHVYVDYWKIWCCLMSKRKCLCYGSSNKTTTTNIPAERLVNGF